MTVDISVSVCVCVCTVTYFSAKDKANGVKFCTAIHWRPRQGISHFPPEAQNRTNRPAPTLNYKQIELEKAYPTLHA